MKRLIFILLLAAQTAFGAQAYYSRVTVDHTKVPSDQTNFAVLVNQTDARLKVTGSGGHVTSSSGYDIRPYSDAALTTALTYQLGNYVSTTGEVQMWVKIPSLSSTVDTVIYLGYGDASLTTDGSSTSTWDSNYIAIWHMNDNAATTTVLKATSTGANATNIANTSTKTVAGQIGPALTYNGTTDAASSVLDLSGTATVTLSFWMKWTTNANDDKLAFEYTNNYNGKKGFVANWNAAGGAFSFGTSSDTSNTHWTDTFTRPSAGAWHKIDLYMKRTATLINKAYVDGVLQTLTTANHDIAVDANFESSTFYFLSRGTASLFGAGVADEVRLSTIERTQDWITTEFNNQNAPSSFETLGTEVSTTSTTSTGFFLFFP